MNELQSAAGVALSLKSLIELAKSLADAAGSTKLSKQATELYRQILAAQESALTANAAQAALVDEKRQLEARIAQFEAWDREAERYELADVGTGCVAYVLKAETQSRKPFHMLCANCYERRLKRYLQRARVSHMRRPVYACGECGSEITVQDRGRAAAEEDSELEPPRVIYE